MGSTVVHCSFDPRARSLSNWNLHVLHVPVWVLCLSAHRREYEWLSLFVSPVIDWCPVQGVLRSRPVSAGIGWLDGWILLDTNTNNWHWVRCGAEITATVLTMHQRAMNVVNQTLTYCLIFLEEPSSPNSLKYVVCLVWVFPFRYIFNAFIMKGH